MQPPGYTIVLLTYSSLSSRSARHLAEFLKIKNVLFKTTTKQYQYQNDINNKNTNKKKRNFFRENLRCLSEK
jgi:hypothetical protein